jgi:hypothetical protein
MNVQKLEDNIYYYTEIFSDIYAYRSLIDESSLDWHPWLSSNGNTEYGMYAGGENQLPDNILDPIKYVTYSCLTNYTENTGIEFGWIPNFYKIQKYSNGSYMGPHVDSIDKTADKSPTISIVLYLNEDYEGGNICFPEQGLDIKPKAGSMIIFPSYPPYYHDPKPVTKGTKYMCPIFCFKEPF